MQLRIKKVYLEICFVALGVNPTDFTAKRQLHLTAVPEKA